MVDLPTTEIIEPTYTNNKSHLKKYLSEKWDGNIVYRPIRYIWPFPWLKRSFYAPKPIFVITPVLW